ncbi:adenylyltransferase/cytidyltransferase family protein [Candidatus Parcubacteria bacterium]|nr:adenylyltransferase/cytidyltransferase family protein [Candidatus Parcubacteria bacterium]
MSQTKITNTKQISYNKIKVMTFGTFDIFHPGHESFLKQARKFGDYLIVVIARDKTVGIVKKRFSQNNEINRQRAVVKSNLADKVILGSLKDKYQVIKKYQPEIICLGYDQTVFIENLREKLKEFGMEKTKIVKLKPYCSEKYKSSKLRD